MRHITVLACIALLIIGVACGNGNDASDIAARCERVREHLIELELPGRDDDANAAREARAGVMRRAMGKEFLASCARSIEETQANCILSAADSKSASACIARFRSN